MSSLDGKVAIVFGVANKRSIAWAIAQAWAKAGAKLAFTYQGERLKENVEELAGTFGSDTLLIPCDVTKDADIDRVFSELRQKFGRGVLLRGHDFVLRSKGNRGEEPGQELEGRRQRSEGRGQKISPGPDLRFRTNPRAPTEHTASPALSHLPTYPLARCTAIESWALKTKGSPNFSGAPFEMI